MKPYFETSHLAGVLLLIVTLAWGAMEAAHLSNTREGAAKVGGAGRQFAVLPSMIAAAAVLYLAPHIIPAAALRPGAVYFTVGLVILVAGLVLRGWSVKVLGEYFTGAVKVSRDQPVVTAGPYRLLRHPSYTGLLLAFIGLGLTSANWAGAAAMFVLILAAVLWRIHAEERALLATLGGRYGAYATQHKRLVPLIW